MELSAYLSWASHEERNGFECGQSAALNGRPMISDVTVNMPRISDKMAAESWTKLVAIRTAAYEAGFKSVTVFTTRSSDKKSAESAAASMKCNGYTVQGIQKVSKYEFVITAATAKRTGLPYGAKVAA